MANIRNQNEYTLVSGTSGNDTIYNGFRKNDVTIAAGAGNDIVSLGGHGTGHKVIGDAAKLDEVNILGKEITATVVFTDDDAANQTDRRRAHLAKRLGDGHVQHKRRRLSNQRQYSRQEINLRGCCLQLSILKRDNCSAAFKAAADKKIIPNAQTNVGDFLCLVPSS